MLNEYEMASLKIKSDKVLLETSYYSIDSLDYFVRKVSELKGTVTVFVVLMFMSLFENKTTLFRYKSV